MTTNQTRDQLENNQDDRGALCHQGTLTNIFFLFFTTVGILTVACGFIAATIIAVRRYRDKQRLVEEKRMAEAEAALSEPTGFDKAMEFYWSTAMNYFPTSNRHGLANLTISNLHLAILGLFVLSRLQYLSNPHSLFSPETALEALTIVATVALWYYLSLIEDKHKAEIARLKGNTRRATRWQELASKGLLGKHSVVQDVQRGLGGEATISQDEIPSTAGDHQDLRNKIKAQESQIKGLLELRRRQQQDARGETGGIDDERYLRSEIKLNELKIDRLQEAIQRAARNGP
ncbi:hypothetical protein G7Y79_00041g077760 [Physcia stellaris]|nr:hypothetical protein G7Y79_00041g077760 [Physcia stellaris]